MRASVWFAVIVGLLLAQFSTAAAQTLDPPQTELEKRQGAEYRLEAFGPDLMGDGIDPHTGAISFSQTDVSLPGNFALEVAVRRQRSQGRFYREGVALEFGDWQIDVPRIHALMASTLTWTNRCSTPIDTAFPTLPMVGNYTRQKYSNGVVLDAGGVRGEQMMQSPTGAQWPSGTIWATVGG